MILFTAIGWIIRNNASSRVGKTGEVRQIFLAEINVFHYPSNAPARQLTSLPRLCCDLQGGSQYIASRGRFSISTLQFEPFNTGIVRSLQYRKSDICSSLASYRLASCRYSLLVVSSIDRNHRFYQPIPYSLFLHISQQLSNCSFFL